MVDHDDFIRCDPDHRQNRGNGECKTFYVEPELLQEIYASIQPYRKQPAYIIDDYTVDKMLRRRGVRV